MEVKEKERARWQKEKDNMIDKFDEDLKQFANDTLALVEVEKMNKAIDLKAQKATTEKQKKAGAKKRRYIIPKDFLFKESRVLFKEPEVTPCKDVEVRNYFI